MRILVTNDDGILAPGIEALYVAMLEFGEVEVVAPGTAQSAMGHAISVLQPLTAQRVHVNGVFHGWSVDGRPADCVKLAMLELLPWKPDFVVSGVNAGANTGINVLYSGTVAGAAEGAFFGVPSAAFSLKLSDELDFRRAAAVAREVFRTYVASKPARGACLNVNIPALDAGWPKGIRVCPQSSAPMLDRYDKQTDGAGRAIYILDGRLPDHSDQVDTDLEAIEHGYVAVTPLRFDMTDHRLLPALGAWGWPTGFNG